MMKIMSAKCSNTNIGIKKYAFPRGFTRYHISFHPGTMNAEKTVNVR